MTAKIIGVIQVKGGAGRSTVSTNLAGELSKLGKTVLIDCDMPQGTSASWYAVRQGKGKEGDLVADTALTHRELIAKVEQYQDADYIVLDGPPRIAELTKAILILTIAFTSLGRPCEPTYGQAGSPTARLGQGWR